jgi:hypothetical protein
MGKTENLEELQQATPRDEYKRLEEKRRSLEEKTKILEEKARTEKLAIDKNLFVQILEEENRTHNDAVKELEGKIASFEQRLKSPSTTEETPSPLPSEPAQEISNDVDEGVTVGALSQPEQSEVEVPQEGSRKKRRSLF